MPWIRRVGGSTALCNKFIAATAGTYDAEATSDGLKISCVDVKQALRVLTKAEWSQNALKGACGVLKVDRQPGTRRRVSGGAS